MLYGFLRYSIAIVFLLSAGSYSYAQTVEESWLRQAGITCGGGQSIDVEGQLDFAVISRLRAATGTTEGSYNAAELKALLEQFRETEKSSVYKNYIQCLLTTMQMATNASGLPPREVKLESPIVVDPLQVVKRGQRVALSEGESIAVGSLAIILSVHDVTSNNRLHYQWSNSQNGETERMRAKNGAPIKIREDCIVVPYKMDKVKGTVSLIVNC